MQYAVRAALLRFCLPCSTSPVLLPLYLRVWSPPAPEPHQQVANRVFMTLKVALKGWMAFVISESKHTGRVVGLISTIFKSLNHYITPSCTYVSSVALRSLQQRGRLIRLPECRDPDPPHHPSACYTCSYIHSARGNI